MRASRGYTVARVTAAGAGAAEVWRAVLDDRAADAGKAERIGEVGPVYDRTVYLELTAAEVAKDLLGPPMVMLAPEGIEGPLATTVETTEPTGLLLDDLEPGARVRCWAAAGARSGEARYVIRVGDTLDLLLDPVRLQMATGPDPRYHDLDALQRESPIWQRARRALDVLIDEGDEDGLGWLVDLDRLAGDERPNGDLEALIDGWAAVVGYRESDVPIPSTDILGRGPGATPAGDDVTAGLVLGLRRTTEGAARTRIRHAGGRMIEVASSRTTTVSTALLAQAVRGRTAPRVEAALRGLLAPDTDPEVWMPAVRAAADLGHTSGIDTLVGALAVPLGVGPRNAGRD